MSSKDRNGTPKPRTSVWKRRCHAASKSNPPTTVNTWGYAELRDHIGGSEVIDLHAQFAKRRTERNEGRVDALGISAVGANPNIHVSGSSWQTMRC